MPHVVCLQEVTHDSARIFKQGDWWQQYHTSLEPNSPYFTLLACKFKPLAIKRLPFQSKMGRDVLVCNAQVKTSKGLTSLTFATSHLESMSNQRAVRRHQMENAFKLLTCEKQATDDLLYMGDMNLETKDENMDLVASYGWQDAWLIAHKDEGFTYDYTCNPYVSAYRSRLDRIFLKLSKWELTSVRKVGEDDVKVEAERLAHFRSLQVPNHNIHNGVMYLMPELTHVGRSSTSPVAKRSAVLPSDHFGLVASLKFKS